MLAIIGTGLIGGSIGLRARASGMHVGGWDSDAAAAAEAARVGAIDETMSYERIIAEAQTIVIAAPVPATIEHLARLRATPPARATLVIDVASVKAPIVQAARGLSAFVATHPMAGRERSGPSAATADLFSGRPWLYVPTGDGTLDERAIAFIDQMGALAAETDADAHDRIVATTSHAPHIVAAVIARRIAGADTAYLGPSAREFVRLAHANEALWRGIIDGNRDNVVAELEAVAAALHERASALRANSG